MVRSRQRFPSSRRRNPNRSWGGTIFPTYTTVAAGSKVLLTTVVLSNPGIDETILRTVGNISIQSDQLAAGEQQLGAFGLIVVTDLAIAAGVASIPDPVTDAADDGWFVYVPFAQSFAFASAVGFDSKCDRLYSFDSKAKRKFEEGQTIAVVVANAHSTHGLQISAGFRILSMVSGT